MQAVHRHLSRLAAGLEETLRLPQIRRYPLDEVHRALQESEGGHLRGELVVTA